MISIYKMPCILGLVYSLRLSSLISQGLKIGKRRNEPQMMAMFASMTLHITATVLYLKAVISEA